jgi:hypothetical protein
MNPCLECKVRLGSEKGKEMGIPTSDANFTANLMLLFMGFEVPIFCTHPNEHALNLSHQTWHGWQQLPAHLQESTIQTFSVSNEKNVSH